MFSVINIAYRLAAFGAGMYWKHNLLVYWTLRWDRRKNIILRKEDLKKESEIF